MCRAETEQELNYLLSTVKEFVHVLFPGAEEITLDLCMSGACLGLATWILMVFLARIGDGRGWIDHPWKQPRLGDCPLCVLG